MNETLSAITIEWLVPRFLLGIFAGYSLRVLEHILWSLKAKPEENERGNLNFALVFLPQAIVVGVAVGFLLLAITALYLQNSTAMNICAVTLPALMAFFAGDLRELLRRISRF